MRSKLCEDGKRKILAKVEVPVDIESMTHYTLAHPDMNNGQDPMKMLTALNKREIFALAKTSIRLWGVDLPSKSVQAKWDAEYIQTAQKYIKKLFPEVD